MPPIRKLALVANAGKEGAMDLARDLRAIASRAHVKVRLTSRFPLPAGFLRGQDACCVIGGDGTLLGIARDAVRARVPVIGVNRGSLGFLTTFSADEARSHFKELLSGRYRIAERSLLACSSGGTRSDIALNDVLIKDAVSSRIVQLEVRADGELVTEYSCDGLIFSTPTGSTAYNLSAGGPILHPSAEVIAMTPICPHTLSNRSIIFRQGVKLRVYNRSPRAKPLVALDGRVMAGHRADRPVEISIHKARLQLLQRSDHSHFSIVRTKLKWSGGIVDRPSSGRARLK